VSKYKNSDGSAVTLYSLVRLEPDWAVSRIEFMEKRITELAAKLQNAQEDKLDAIKVERKRWAREDIKAQTKRDLEQQAKACTDLIGMWKAMESHHLTIADLQRRSEYLLEQAKQLKGEE